MTDITEIGETFWTTVWSDIKNGGTPFFMLLLLFILWTTKKYIGEFFVLLLDLLKGKAKKKSKTYTKKDVINHPVFKDLDFWLSTGIPAIKLYNIIPSYSAVVSHIDSEDYMKAKEDIAKDLLTIKYRTIQEYLKKFINEYDIDTLDIDLLTKYFDNALRTCKTKQQQEMREAGIPDKFLIKYFVYERLATDILKRAVGITLDENAFDLDINSRAYLILTEVDNYLAEIFNNIVHTVESINGDLNGEEYKGNIIGQRKVEILQPPHPSFGQMAREVLNEIRSVYSSSRAYVIRYYYDKSNTKKFSCVYEVCDNGITSEILNLQDIPADRESDIYNILSKGEIISADISKFNNYTSNRLTSRGIDAIIMVPLFEDDKLIGIMVLDYVSKELYKQHKDEKDMDNKLKEYAKQLTPYISYPKDYKF